MCGGFTPKRRVVDPGFPWSELSEHVQRMKPGFEGFDLKLVVHQGNSHPLNIQEATSVLSVIFSPLLEIRLTLTQGFMQM